MKALVKDGDTVAVRTVPDPELRRDDDVLIRVALAGVCRTDIYAAEGKLACANPLILGHEFSGTVVARGPKAGDFRPGERVAVNPAIPCESCRACRADRFQDCADASFLGVQRDGAFAELVAVPAHAVFKLPGNVSFLAGAYLEPVAASLAVLYAGIAPRERGLIYGDNRLARLLLKVLSAHGFRNTIVCGVTHPALSQRERENNGISEPDAFDFIIETLATTQTLRDMLRAIRPRGKIILKSRPYLPVALDVAEVIRKEAIICAVNCGSYHDALDLLATQRVTIDDLAGAQEPLENFAAVFAASKESEALKLFFSMAEH